MREQRSQEMDAGSEGRLCGRSIAAVHVQGSADDSGVEIEGATDGLLSEIIKV
jgi:hypothetical protein